MNWVKVLCLLNLSIHPNLLHMWTLYHITWQHYTGWASPEMTLDATESCLEAEGRGPGCHIWRVGSEPRLIWRSLIERCYQVPLWKLWDRPILESGRSDRVSQALWKCDIIGICLQGQHIVWPSILIFKMSAVRGNIKLNAFGLSHRRGFCHCFPKAHFWSA